MRTRCRVVVLVLLLVALLVVPFIVAPPTPPPGTAVVHACNSWFDGVENWGTWLRSLVDKLLPWPAVILLLGGTLLLSRTAVVRLAQLFVPLRSVKLWGAELVISEEGAKTVAQSAEERFLGYREQVRREFEREASKRFLADKVQVVVTRAIGNKWDKVKFKKLRSTIHVQDILFQDRLYQLLNYYPGNSGSGRTKSIRFGIIGRAWRSQIHTWTLNVSTDEERVGSYGMTRAEADQLQRATSFLCVMLHHESTPVGILYFDHEEANAFGDDVASKELCESLERMCRADDVRLTQELAELARTIVGPRLNIDEVDAKR